MREISLSQYLGTILWLFLVAACSAPDRDPLRLAAAEVEACRGEKIDIETFEIPGSLASAGAETQIWTSPTGAVCFDGPISYVVYAWFDERLEPVTTLVMRSPGGSGSTGIAIGEKLREWGTTFVVWDKCYSACAGGPFIGAPMRLVPEPAIVGWHGSLALTRFEALVLAGPHDDEALNQIQRFATARYRDRGRNDVPDTVWYSLPQLVRERLLDHPTWRLRQQRLFNDSDIDLQFIAAFYAVPRNPPEFMFPALSELGNSRSIFWTPDKDELVKWGFDPDGLFMWGPADASEIFEIGYNREPATINVRVSIDPGEFPIVDDPNLPDDSAEWPIYDSSD